MNAIITFQNGEQKLITPKIYVSGNETCVTLPRFQLLDESIECVELDTGIFEADAKDCGYLFFSGGINFGTSLTYFKERDDAFFESEFVFMSCFGMQKNGTGTFAIVTGMESDFKVALQIKDGRYKMTPKFYLDGDDPYDDIQMKIYHMPGATYNEMAHLYQRYQIEKWGLLPLSERVKNNEALKKAAESIEVRIRMGWKPVPSPVKHQTSETEPPMKVACDFQLAEDLIDECKRQGVLKAEFCLVGWNKSGHDGRFPQLFPPEPALGGTEGLTHLIQKARSEGFSIVCHDNYTAAYECADCWDEEFVAKEKNGRLASRHYENPPLSGGQPFMTCPKRSYERFMPYNLPKYRDLGFSGLHFIDVLSAVPARKCYDPNHPINHRDCRDYYLKIMENSRAYIGGMQSEGPYDYIAAQLDSILYVSMNPVLQNNCPIADEEIPFWQLVYHGYILSNPSSHTINYPIKDKAAKLKTIEYGGRPLMYFYSRFVDEEKSDFKNWMGETDLTLKPESRLKHGVSALKQAYDDYEALFRLQYAFMERHEKLSEGVYRTTYSDGTAVVVDYNNETYQIDDPNCTKPVH